MCRDRPMRLSSGSVSAARRRGSFVSPTHILTIFLTMVVSKMVRNDDFTASLVGIVPRMFAIPDKSVSSSLAERDELKENLLLAM